MPDKQTAKGRMTEAKGKVRDTAGRATGNDRMRAKGKAEQAKGKGQSMFGKAREKLRDMKR